MNCRRCTYLGAYCLSLLPILSDIGYCCKYWSSSLLFIIIKDVKNLKYNESGRLIYLGLIENLTNYWK